MTDPQTPTDLAPITDLELTQLETLVTIPKRMNPIFLKMLAEIRQSRGTIARLEAQLRTYLIKGDEALFERAEAAEARARTAEGRVGKIRDAMLDFEAMDCGAGEALAQIRRALTEE
jgi:hypothetical protein